MHARYRYGTARGGGGAVWLAMEYRVQLWSSPPAAVSSGSRHGRRHTAEKRRRERGEASSSGYSRLAATWAREKTAQPTSGSKRRSRPASSQPRHRALSSPPRLPQRAESSLGFSTDHGSTTSWGRSQAAQGFDVTGYLRERGSSSKIHFGVNGEATREGFFAPYLRECREHVEEEIRATQCRATSSLSSESEEEPSLSQEAAGRDGGSSRRGPASSREGVSVVPLSWDSQLKQAKVCGCNY